MRGFILKGSKITADGDGKHEIKKRLAPWKKSYDQPRQHIKKQRHHFANKSLYSQSYGFSSESLAIKKAEYLLSLEADSLPSEPPGKPRIDMN